MSEMDEDIRKGILDLFDRTINDIKSTDEGAQMYLIRMGIEPTLENVLAYLTGIFVGGAGMVSIVKHNEMRAEDMQGTSVFMEERAWILREALLRSRNQ